MTLKKLNLTPVQASYTFAHGQETLRVRLDGGASRFRRDILGSSSILNVRWQANSTDYQFLQAFYRSVSKNGSLPFLIDLVIDYSQLREYRAYFIPGSFRLASQAGHTYNVSAQLEVLAIDRDEDYDEAFIAAYEAHGRQASNTGQELEDFVNEFLPDRFHD